MKKTLSIVLFVLLVFLAVACSPEHTHDYKLVPEKSIEATCTANGFNYMVCSCGAIQSIPTAALGHDYVEDKDQYVASTCRTKGRKVSVCSRCDEVKEVTLPLDVNNHPFAEAIKDDDGKITDYVGVYESLKNGAFTTVPTCANDGEGVFTECTACGKTGEFTVVVPSSVVLSMVATNIPSGHVKVDADGKAVSEIGAEDVVEWKTTKEPTAFVTGLETAYCPTCGKLVETDSKAEDLIDEDIPVKKDAVLGFYSLKTAAADADKNYDLYTISASKKNGSYNFDVYRMDVTEQKVYSTKNEKMVGAYSKNAATSTNLYDGAMYFTLTGSDGLAGTTIILTEVTSIATTSKDALGNTLTVGDRIAKVGDNVYKLASPSDHEHSFTLMADERAVSIVGSDEGHYLECADCGLKYVFESHASGCEVCGWTEKWYKVNIGSATNASSIPGDGDIFYVEKRPTYKLASSGEYKFFLGGTKEYNELLALNDSSSYYTTENSDGSFTLTTGYDYTKAMGIGLKKN